MVQRYGFSNGLQSKTERNALLSSVIPFGFAVGIVVNAVLRTLLINVGAAKPIARSANIHVRNPQNLSKMRKLFLTYIAGKCKIYA